MVKSVACDHKNRCLVLLDRLYISFGLCLGKIMVLLLLLTHAREARLAIPKVTLFDQKREIRKESGQNDKLDNNDRNAD